MAITMRSAMCDVYCTRLPIPGLSRLERRVFKVLLIQMFTSSVHDFFCTVPNEYHVMLPADLPLLM